MPAGLVALLPLILGGAGAATTIGSTIYNDVDQPGVPKPAPAATPTGPTAQQVTAATTPQALSIESATGGSVSPDYLSTIAPIFAGVGGQPNTPAGLQAVIQQLFGNKSATPGGAGGTAPFTPSGVTPNLSALAATPGTSDYLQKIASGGF